MWVLFHGYYTVEILQSEKIVGGGSAVFNGYSCFVVARYNSDGSADNSFGNEGIVTTSFGNVNTYGRSLAIQEDGKIVVTGEKGGWPSDYATARYNTDGTLDTTFGNGGIVISDLGSQLEQPRDILIQDDGKMIVAGGSVSFALARHMDYFQVAYAEIDDYSQIMYPNPCRRYLFLDFSRHLYNKAILMDKLGNVMTVIQNDCNQTVKLDIPVAGCYFLQVFEDDMLSKTLKILSID